VIINQTFAFNGYLPWIRSGGSFSRPVLTSLVHSMRQDAGHSKRSGEGRLRPSLIGDPCDRKQVLSHRYGDGSDFNGNWFTWSGTFLHLAFQTWLLDQWRKRLRIEHKIIPRQGEAGVTGKADWYWFGEPLNTPDGAINAPHIGDYKTATNLKNRKQPVQDAHLQQLLAEMYTTGLDRAYLVYQDRAYGDIKAYELRATDDDLMKMGHRLNMLQAFIDKDDLPDLLTPCKSHSGPYKDCNFARICMKEAYGEEAVGTDDEDNLFIPAVE
jgi:hypothetical protein